ncbi:uncharacterized protein K02A2.6-like [Rhagoletis pomonella]|uniref:uncharacterized protein K02A2.6-like n=1 Tax=Rhagoletis pomonella TaxID=28610 RepID=UPI00177FEF6A|nr:uncharacterized protein K02A2.6-like [Rhagoletis pomonella]
MVKDRKSYDVLKVDQLFSVSGGKSKPQSINQILSSRSRKKSTTIYINQKPCKFEVDSGSDYTIVSSKTFDQLWPGVKPLLYECGLELSDFQHNGVPNRGVLDVDIENNKRPIKDLPLIIVNGNQSNVLGCNWFDALGISVQGVLAIEESPTIKHILGKFEHLFSKELGKFRGEPVSLQVKNNIQPIRLPARRIPIAIRSLVETELDRLCAQGIFEPVEYSDWATPIVPVLKSDGTIRICGDYKSSLNKAMLPHNFQIPSISSLISSIEGGKIFAKLDLAQAYQQLAVDEHSAMLQTVATHKGAFKVNRLQFGISSAPRIFQNFIDVLLRNIPCVLPYFDDVVIMGGTETELSERINEVLSRFDKSGLHLRRDRCKFGVHTIHFLGYKTEAARFFGLPLVELDDND